MSITATECKQNFGKYLIMAATQDIFITQYGKVVAVLSNPTNKKISSLNALKGFLKAEEQSEIEDAKWKRLSEKCGL